jgi:hypothetical protein
MIRLGLVEIAEDTDIVRATIIGVMPVLVGIIVIALIGGAHFDMAALRAAFSTGDVSALGDGLGKFVSAPNFLVWIYLIFAIANAMLPEEHDRINWWLLAGALVGLAVFLLVLDLGILVQAGLDGPLADLASMMSLALTLSLAIDLAVMGIISLTEWAFGRFLNREIEYQ